MTTYAKFKNYAQWLEKVVELCGSQEKFDYYSEWYSFKSAYDDKMTPEQAYQDSKEWLDM